MRQRQIFSLVAIFALTIVAAVFVYPKGPVAAWREWRLGLDLVGGSHLVYRVDLANVPEADRESVLAGLRDVIERRVNLFGVAEPQVYVAKEGTETHLVAELAGVKDIAEAIKQIGETPFLEFREIRQVVVNGTSTAEFAPTELTGRYVTGAELIFNETTGAPQVSLTFNDEGALLFEEITGRNVGQPVAIYLDGTPISTPIVNEKIAGGKAEISGQFTVDEARELVERFNAGALPAPVTLINQQTTSATLGRDSLERAVKAGAIGTGLVILFMLLWYRGLGIYAAVALVIYIVLTLAIFKAFGITLTLAGIAGFILTIGMAVDANILVFERVREEMRRGLSRAAAMHEGFKHAWPSIKDSNISSLLTAVILYFFTTSFVRGFALTLFLGVLVSMFTALTATRLMLDVFARERAKTGKLVNQ